MTINISYTEASNNDNDGFNIGGPTKDLIFEYCIANDNGTDGVINGNGDAFTLHDTSEAIVRYSIAKNNKK